MINDYVTTGVPARAVDRVWEEVTPLLELVDFWGRTSIDELYKDVKSMEMQLWIMEKLGSGKPTAAALTSVIDHPHVRVIRVNTLGGKDMANWAASFNEAMDKFAERVGASYIEAHTREGMARRLRAEELGGYERLGVLVQRAVHRQQERISEA